MCSLIHVRAKLLLLLLVGPGCVDVGTAAQHEARQHKYCIIGAGPSGLQLAHELQRNGRDYIIFERNAQAGSFFERFPRHDTLISVNKLHTGSSNTEFNLRHDWNSLLSDRPELRFGQYSRQLFPHRRHLVRYLNDFQRQLGLRVAFNTSVLSVRRSGALFLVETAATSGGGAAQWQCQVMLLATGLSLPREVRLAHADKMLYYHNMSMELSQFTRKRVLIVGKGNAAFETAAAIQDESAFTHLLSRHRLRLAWATHYVGDLRAVNNNLLDMYQLKTLDALLDADIQQLQVEYRAQDKVFTYADSTDDLLEAEKKKRSAYDVIILCLGWLFDLVPFRGLNMTLGGGGGDVPLPSQPGKYPSIAPHYESTEQAHVFVLGTAAHSLDWRRSAGGFIHGFRYTARSLARLLQARYDATPWPFAAGSLADHSLVNHIVKRINEASSLYQMFGELCDVAIVDKARSSFVYLQDFPVHALHQLPTRTGHHVPVDGAGRVHVLVVMLEYGRNFSGPAQDVFYEERATADERQAWRCNFLHPVVYYYSALPGTAWSRAKSRPTALLHLIEDLHTDFRSRASYVIPLTAFLETSLQLRRSTEPITQATDALRRLLHTSSSISGAANASQLVEWPFAPTRNRPPPVVPGFAVTSF